MVQHKRQQYFKLAEDRIAEFIKCSKNFDYFCRNYIYIELPGGDQLLQPYDEQVNFTTLLKNEHYVLVLKSRQIGISTITQAYTTWLIVFHDNVVAGIISKDGKEATDFARAIRGMVEKLPDWMKPPKGVMGRGFAKRTEQSFILTNGSKVYASPVAPNAPEKTFRGKAITFLVIDEAAFIKFIDVAWTSMVSSLSTSQMHARKMGIPYGTLILSTPNKTTGVGKWFFQHYSKASVGEGIFKQYTIHWSNIPELKNDPSWYKTQCDLFDNDQRKISQELELKFLPTEGSFFESDIMEKLQLIENQPLEILKLFNGEAWKFSNSIPGRHYLIGVDTAPEFGEDKSAITVWDYETLEQVWEYVTKCKVGDFVKVVKVACSLYPGTLVVENNSYGNQVAEEMNNSEFSFMLYKEKRGEKRIPGLSTNVKTRPLMIDSLYSYISRYPEIIKSKRLALELIGLVTKTSGKVEAEDGAHDDLALATSCCFYVRKFDPPVVISSQHGGNIDEMASILSLNLEGGSGISELTNSKIMDMVKRNMEDPEKKQEKFVDILEMYNIS
jgi:hypothetical protein